MFNDRYSLLYRAALYKYLEGENSMKCTNFEDELFRMKMLDAGDEPQEEQGHIVDLVLATATKKSEIAKAISEMKKRKPTDTDDTDAGPGAVGEGWEKANEQTLVQKDWERIR